MKKVALSPQLLERAGNVAKSKAKNLMGAIESSKQVPSALTDQLSKRLRQSDKFLAASKKPKLQSVKKPSVAPVKKPEALVAPANIAGDKKHIESLQLRVAEKYKAQGLGDTEAWNNAMSLKSKNELYKELGMKDSKQKRILSNAWTGTKAASANFWNGFEKKAEYTPEQNIQDLQNKGGQWEDVGRKSRWGYLGIPAAAAGYMATKNPLLRAGAVATGLGGLFTGYVGERGIGYGKGLQTISKHLKGEKTTENEWNNLIMNNPSGSLMRHVHPQHRLALAKKWSEEYRRFHNTK